MWGTPTSSGSRWTGLSVRTLRVTTISTASPTEAPGPVTPGESREFRTGLRIKDCRSPGREDTQLVQPAMVPGGSQLSGVLLVTDVAERVTVPPLLKMPPPWAAVLPVTWL